ncbi:MAG: hypothetical protein ACREU4_07915, partial [Burkholderiales bacterium]
MRPIVARRAGAKTCSVRGINREAIPAGLLGRLRGWGQRLAAAVRLAPAPPQRAAAGPAGELA